MRTISQAQSSLQGAWPGRLGQVGQLPHAWSAKSRGLVIDVVSVGSSTNGVDLVEMRLWGTASEAGFAEITLAPAALVVDPVANEDPPPPVGEVEMGVYLAVTGGSRNNVPKAHLGIETRDANGNVTDSPTAEISEWQRLGPRPLPVTATIDLGGGAFATAAPYLALEIATGSPIDITIAIGWSFSAAKAAPPPPEVPPPEGLRMPRF